MKNIFLWWLFSLTATITSSAQVPQYALVRPDGTTTICTSWDSAYSKAVDGDNIYLPGATINSVLQIDKRLNIYGAGHHPDSTAATGKTSINAFVLFLSNSSGSRLEGVQLAGTIYLQYSGKRIRDILIRRCHFTNLHFTNGSTPTDSLPGNITVAENIFSSLEGFRAPGNFFLRNIIRTNMNFATGSLFLNNIFLCTSSQFSSIEYCTFRNNIFASSIPFGNATTCTDIFENNLKIGSSSLLAGCPVNTGTETGTLVVNSINDLFQAYNTSGSGFPYADNYHLPLASPGINAGTDGTDVGMYGSSQPTPAGWVPSNPHIYLRQVAAQSNAAGQLQIQFGVRTNN